ncbi:hypothetical protein P280DRAFT_468496 [Massarina eburnea CBS 473.64]|uniref:Uncharacterized protein n=1 Tax=Massarina eburnea CBS 473.64 TaxID=1395130 RepID=A0A6A6S2C2_9PLEO|nr:hypothetical protein P280DRAFT_468496 [Massarina eburnea CBS 473.64]
MTKERARKQAVRLPVANVTATSGTNRNTNGTTPVQRLPKSTPESTDAVIAAQAQAIKELAKTLLSLEGEGIHHESCACRGLGCDEAEVKDKDKANKSKAPDAHGKTPEKDLKSIRRERNAQSPQGPGLESRRFIKAKGHSQASSPRKDALKPSNTP